jgi:carbon storage regulator
MLVFSRRKGQRIVIANEIEIIVTQTSRGAIKLAVRAPARYSVLRGEVFDAIAEANRAAAGLEPVAGAEPASAEAAVAGSEPAEPESEREPGSKLGSADHSASISTP